MQTTPKSQGLAKQLSFRLREHTQKNVPGHCVFVPYAPWGGAKTLQSNGSENHRGHAWQLISNRVSISPSHERTYIRTSPFLKILLPQSTADTETFGSLYKSFMRLSCQKESQSTVSGFGATHQPCTTLTLATGSYHSLRIHYECRCQTERNLRPEKEVERRFCRCGVVSFASLLLRFLELLKFLAAFP